MRPPASPVVRRSADGVHPIAALPPRKLDPTAVADVGVVRAAYDAVRNDARVAAIKAAAKAQSQDSFTAAVAATANLVRRTAEAHAG